MSEKERQKWLRMDDENGWQIVIPDHDILPHSTETKGDKRELAWSQCPCKPKIDYMNRIVIHNSFEDAKRVDDTITRLLE